MSIKEITIDQLLLGARAGARVRVRVTPRVTPDRNHCKRNRQGE